MKKKKKSLGPFGTRRSGRLVPTPSCVDELPRPARSRTVVSFIPRTLVFFSFFFLGLAFLLRSPFFFVFFVLECAAKASGCSTWFFDGFLFVFSVSEALLGTGTPNGGEGGKPEGNNLHQRPIDLAPRHTLNSIPRAGAAPEPHGEDLVPDACTEESMRYGGTPAFVGTAQL